MGKRLYPFYFSAIILTAFTIGFLLKQNYEFLLYTFTLGLVIFILAKTDKIFKYNSFIKWCFSIWLFSHLAGGAFYFNGLRLYDTILINILGEPFNIFKYDQLIHIFCFFVFTCLIYSVMVVISKPQSKGWIIMLLALFGRMGIGAINEIIEFSTVVFFNSTGVGGYYNNALDLFFNLIGSIIAVFYMKNINLFSK